MPPRIGFDCSRWRVNSPGMANESFSFEEAIGLTPKPQPSGAADRGGFSFEEALGKPTQASPGFIPTIKRTGGQMLTTAATAAEDVVGPNAVTRAVHEAGQGIIDRNPAGIRSLRDLVDSPWLAVKESVGQFAPQIAAAAVGGAAGARAGAALGSVAGPAGAATGGAIGGVAGSLLPIFTQEYGGIRQEQKESGQEDKARALAAAIPATALERVGMGKALNVLKGVPGGPGAILKEVGKGVLKEGATEGAQTVIEQWGAFKDPTKAENLEDTALSASMGGIGGGVMGAGAGVVDGAVARRAQARQSVDEQAGTPATPDAPVDAGAPGAPAINPADGPLSKAASMAGDLGLAPVPAAPTPEEQRAQLEATISRLPEAEQREARLELADADNEALPAGVHALRNARVQDLVDGAPPAPVELTPQDMERGRVLQNFDARQADLPPLADYAPLIDEMVLPERRAEFQSLLATATDPKTSPAERDAAAEVLHATFSPDQLQRARTRPTPETRLELQDTNPARFDNGIDFTPAPSTSTAPDAMAERINQLALDADLTPGQALQLNQAHALRRRAAEQGITMSVIPHASGRGYDVAPTTRLDPAARQAMPQEESAAQLPYDQSITGRLVAAPDGRVRSETRAEAVARGNAAAERRQEVEAERQRRTELGLSNITPVVPVRDGSARSAAPLTFDNAPTGRMVAGADGVRQERRAEVVNRANQPAPVPQTVVSASGAPFATRQAAQQAQQLQQLASTHEVVPAGGDETLGFVLRESLANQGESLGGKAQVAMNSVADRVPSWRTNAIQANRVARGLGIETQGKRLAQVVAEIDARDAQPTGTSPVAPVPAGVLGQRQAAAQQQRDDYRAAEAKRTAPGARARSAAADANPFKAFIAKHGIALDQRREFAPGTTEQRQAMVPGYGPIFRRTGKPLDLLAQSAVDEGFLASPDAAALHDLIGRALRGERIVAQYTADAAEVEMQSRIARQREMEEDAASEVAELTDASLFDVSDDDIVLTADSNASTEEFLRALGATDQEIEDAIAIERAAAQAGDQGRARAQETDARPAQGSAGQGAQEARPQRVARQDLLGDAPNESQQAAARERARRQQQYGAQRNAAPGPEDFTLGMVDANTGREVAPGQGSIFGAQQQNPTTSSVAASTTASSRVFAPELVAAGADASSALGVSIPSEWDGQQQDRAARPAPRQESVENQAPALDQQAPAATKSGAESAATGPRPARAAAPRSTTRIDDFGEKIGGARKDQDAGGGGRTTRPRSTDERPAWARRFEVSQIVQSSAPGETGRWTVRETRSTDSLGQPRRVGERSYATRKDAEQAIPLIAVGQKHRVVGLRHGEGTGWEIWRDVTDRKRVKVVDQVFQTHEAALEYMVSHAQQIIETNTTFGEADLPRPDSDQRIGAARREGDARDSDFTRVFGFRGVEFGNWNNQDERQQLLNDAYDGLLDLAEVMGIPPRAVSLNGELALAFGARGHGLSGARAHYEPGKAVINLTKMNGAGSLAHEWFHALDHYFARQDGKASAQWAVDKDGTRSLQVSSDSGDNMVSSGTRGERSGLRAELRDAFAELMRTMSRKAEQYLEDTAKADKFVASARADVQQRLDGIRADLARQLDERYAKRNNKPATAEQLAAFDAVAEKIVAGELLDLRVETKGGARSATSGIRWTNDALNQLSAIMKAVRGRQGFNADQDGPLDRLRSAMQHYSARLKMLADAQASSEKTRMVPTRFAMDAKELDQGRGKDYWTTPHEMAARAFQGYVEDKIAVQGGKSPFLNHGPESAAIATPWGWKRPFPVGQERRTINAALDKLVETIRTKEDGESVVLYNTSGEALPERGLSLEQAQQAVEQALAGLSNPPPIDVVVRSEELGVDAPAGVMGVTRVKERRIVIVAGSHRSADAVVETLFHEMFHLGLRNVLPGADYVQSMLDLAKRDPRVQQYANAWKKDASEAPQQLQVLRDRGYRGSELQAQYEALAVEEGLAVVAEELRAQKQAGTRLGMRVRVLANWLASVAERMGMQRLADSIRKMTYNEAERFVLRAIDNAGRAPLEQSGAATDNVTRFRSREGTPAAQRVGDVLQRLSVTNLRQQAGFKATDYRGIGLQFLGRRQLVDVYGDMLPELQRYSDLMARMDADKNEAGAGADQLAQDWAKLPDERALAELMHDSTLAQIDPTQDFVEGDNKTDWTRLRARHQALSPAAKEVFARARDTYRQHMRDVRSAIKERIERAEMSSERRAALLKRMDDEFFGHIKGVYFPLARFGQYVVVVKGADGKVENVSRAETMAEADTTRRQLLAAFPPGKGFTVGKVLKAKDFVAERDTVGRGFMEQLYGVLDKQGMDAKQRAELEDALGQLYLSSLPDLSWAKHGIHRKGTPGFSQDARRAFAQNVFHGASYLAKLRYGDQLQDELGDMQRRVDAGATDGSFDSVKAQQVVDEMVKRHDAAMNPKTNALSTALTSLGFMFHLGLSPASAMVNLTQTALVAYPVMGARWGFAKSGAALLQASQEAARGRNDITASLTADEKAAFDEAVRSGVIDVTMAHDLAGIAQGEDRNVSHKLRPVMKAASFLFHHAEKFNRQVTFVAAYRLARETGADAKAAYAQAAQATYDGHFDYSANNRPRVMQGNVARVLLLFKQYGQNMVYTLVRSAQQSLKGATPEARAQARKALAGLLTTHAMAAGVLGLPMVTTLLAAASMLGGDDDEPWDAKVALQNLLADTFGQKPAEVLAHGLSRLTPWDISGRVGLDKLIFPDVQEGLEGQRLGESAMAAALGPVAGIVVNLFKGVEEMSEGRYVRGLETMMPTALRSPLKALRYGTEGVRDKSGIVVQDEVDAAALWGQAAGFSPSSVRNAYEGKSAIMGHDRALQARRSALVEQFAMAAMAGDEEGKAEAREAVAKFNEKNPNRRILPMQLAQSVHQREKRIREAKEGVYLPGKRRDALEAGRFAVPE